MTIFCATSFSSWKLEKPGCKRLLKLTHRDTKHSNTYTHVENKNEKSKITTQMKLKMQNNINTTPIAVLFRVS